MIGNEPAAAGHEKVSASPYTGLRGIALRGYRWLLLAFLLAGVAQIFLAGLGVFRLQDQTLGGAGGIRPSLRTAPSGLRWPASRWSSWCSR